MKKKTKDTESQQSSVKQAKNKRDDKNFDENGKFADGNKIGNRFQPGVSGNPAGRPRKFRIKEMLGEMVDEKVAVKINGKLTGDKITVLEAMLRGIIKDMLAGDKWSKTYISERLEGRAIQPIIDDEEAIIQFLWESETGEPTEEESNEV